MKKRSIIGFLSLLMVIIMVLGACSGKSKTNQDQYDNPTNASSSNENEKQTNDTDKDVSSTSDRGSLWFDEELVITILLPDNASQPITNFAPAQQEIYNKTNVKLVEEVFVNDDALIDLNREQQDFIVKRAKELIEQYPEKASLFESYIQSQQAECDELENHMTVVTLLLKAIEK